eukprot:GGOE01002919.1.p1 GENE.GGOE01002919.1~~GGOE01002919.1.p1  ORF type:complete len:359 (+),score=72.84 GGOE01002919.1:34-1110(+)
MRSRAPLSALNWALCVAVALGMGWSFGEGQWLRAWAAEAYQWPEGRSHPPVLRRPVTLSQPHRALPWLPSPLTHGSLPGSGPPLPPSATAKVPIITPTGLSATLLTSVGCLSTVSFVVLVVTRCGFRPVEGLQPTPSNHDLGPSSMVLFATPKQREQLHADQPHAEPQPAPAVFLPDHSLHAGSIWLNRRLKEWLMQDGAPLEVLLMPNIYSRSEPEFGASWLMFMEYFLFLDLRGVVVAHGSSAEAVLRFLELNPLQRCILLDAPARCLAPDQNGREYRWDAIARNCASLTLISLAGDRDADARILQQQLAVPDPECLLWGSSAVDTPQAEERAFSALQLAITDRIARISDGATPDV